MWNEFFNVLTVSSCLISAVACLFAVRTAGQLRELQDQFAVYRPYSKQLLETRLTELEESVSLVANRVKMVKVRNAATHVKDSTSEPDPSVDPEGWRAWQNKKLRTGVVN